MNSQPIHPGTTSNISASLAAPDPAWCRYLVALLTLLCFILTLSGSIGRDVYTDEEFDHRATLALHEHPLLGNGLNGSQARLPHYATLVAYKIVEALGFEGAKEWNMTVPRAVSSAAMATTVIFMFLLGRRAAGRNAGLLAALTLAISPYMIGFGGFGYTNGDAFCPLFVTATIWAYIRTVDQPSGRNHAVLALCIGLMVASKFVLVALLPGLVLCDLFTKRNSRATPRQPNSNSARDSWLLPIAISSFVFAFGTMIATRRIAATSLEEGMLIRQVMWIAAILLTVAGMWLLDQRASANFNWLSRWTAILPLAAAISLAFFPEHVFHPDVYRELFELAAGWDGKKELLNIRETLLRYGGIVLLKLGLPLGVITCAAIAWALIRGWRQLPLRAALAVSVAYSLYIAAQPIKQTFYPVAIYPLMILLLSAFILTIVRASNLHAKRAIIVLLAVSYAWLLVGLARVHPYPLLYGYETVGAQWRGYETRGFLGVLFIDEDGTREAVNWSVNNLPPGSKVVSCLRSPSYVERILNPTTHNLHFIQLNWPWLRKKSKDLETIRDADYVIIHLNNRLYDRYHMDFQQIDAMMDPSPIHTVHTGRDAYRNPVVHIYKRKKSSP